jgi:hypothetical protein
MSADQEKRGVSAQLSADMPITKRPPTVGLGGDARKQRTGAGLLGTFWAHLAANCGPNCGPAHFVNLTLHKSGTLVDTSGKLAHTSRIREKQLVKCALDAGRYRKRMTQKILTKWASTNSTTTRRVIPSIEEISFFIGVGGCLG